MRVPLSLSLFSASIFHSLSSPLSFVRHKTSINTPSRSSSCCLPLPCPHSPTPINSNKGLFHSTRHTCILHEPFQPTQPVFHYCLRRYNPLPDTRHHLCSTSTPISNLTKGDDSHLLLRSSSSPATPFSQSPNRRDDPTRPRTPILSCVCHPLSRSTKGTLPDDHRSHGTSTLTVHSSSLLAKRLPPHVVYPPNRPSCSPSTNCPPWSRLPRSCRAPLPGHRPPSSRLHLPPPKYKPEP